MASDVAQLRVEPTGKITAVLSTHSQGHGTQTTMAQVIAEKLGVRFEDVTVLEDDSSRGGFGAGASGSRQAVAGGGASIKCAELLLAKIKRVAAHVLGVPFEDVYLEEGLVHVRGAPERTKRLRDIAEIEYGEPSYCLPTWSSAWRRSIAIDPRRSRSQAPPMAASSRSTWKPVSCT